MSMLVRPGLAVALALAALALTACGDTVIDASKAEDAIRDNVEHTLNVKIDGVDCPSDVKVEAGRSFQCTVTARNGRRATAMLKILNSDADVRFVSFKRQK
jgi:hypothetical protein